MDVIYNWWPVIDNCENLKPSRTESIGLVNLPVYITGMRIYFRFRFINVDSQSSESTIFISK